MALCVYCCVFLTSCSKNIEAFVVVVVVVVVVLVVVAAP